MDFIGKLSAVLKYHGLEITKVKWIDFFWKNLNASQAFYDAVGFCLNDRNELLSDRTKIVLLQSPTITSFKMSTDAVSYFAVCIQHEQGRKIFRTPFVLVIKTGSKDNTYLDIADIRKIED